jgi:hypothetical protein
MGFPLLGGKGIYKRKGIATRPRGKSRGSFQAHIERVTTHGYAAYRARF